MKKILYVMNVDWNWIKQRPHFIAEGLAKENDVTILYQHRYSRKGYQKRNTDGLRIRPIYVIPKGDRYPFLRQINSKIKDAVIRYHVHKTNAECLYLTLPDQTGAVPRKFKGTVIYDCMDNHPAFIHDPKKRAILEQQEEKLVKRASVVLVSSLKLKEELLARYGQQYADKMTLVRNGYDAGDAECESRDPVAYDKKEDYTLAYFGTISSWFNFPFLLKSLEEFPNLRYRLMGPVAPGISIPKTERIEYIGTVEHKDLHTAIADAQCLMMPFEVNEIIESVDPVKLYEYINFNKNILCVCYPEVERFAPFVYFYTDYESFKEQLTQLMSAKKIKYTQEQRTQFLRDNSWASRVRVVERALDK